MYTGGYFFPGHIVEATHTVQPEYDLWLSQAVITRCAACSGATKICPRSLQVATWTATQSFQLGGQLACRWCRYSIRIPSLKFVATNHPYPKTDSCHQCIMLSNSMEAWHNNGSKRRIILKHQQALVCYDNRHVRNLHRWGLRDNHDRNAVWYW